jgi:hypothetical protein
VEERTQSVTIPLRVGYWMQSSVLRNDSLKSNTPDFVWGVFIALLQVVQKPLSGDA